MKTIALNEGTFEMLTHLKRRKKASSFDEVVKKLMQESSDIPDSMFGKLKGKMKSFTSAERKELWKDSERA